LQSVEGDEHAAEPDPVRAIRALSHPLRVRLLDLLRFEGPSTATLLARRVGESSGATSYHLRQLARHGFIEEEQRDGRRERWWRHRERRVVAPGAPGGLSALLTQEAQVLDRFAGRMQPEWDAVAFLHARALRLTPGELDALRRGIEDLLEPLRRADAEGFPADAMPVRVLALGLPHTQEDS
jgi:DNA-binding transcriptional ArsR family regulator